MDKTEIRARLEFRRTALSRLRKAYIALLDGGVKSYTLNDRQLTRFDLPELENAIKSMEAEVDQLEVLLNGRKPRKAFGVVPRDW